MAEVTITDIRKVPVLDPARLGKFDVLVLYSAGPGDNNTVFIPEESFNETTLIAKIRDEERRRTELRGKKLTI